MLVCYTFKWRPFRIFNKVFILTQKLPIQLASWPYNCNQFHCGLIIMFLYHFLKYKSRLSIILRWLILFSLLVFYLEQESKQNLLVSNFNCVQFLEVYQNTWVHNLRNQWYFLPNWNNSLWRISSLHEKTVVVNGIQSNYYLLIFVFQDKTVRMWNIESSDDIPVVLEHRKNIGLRIVQVCSTFYC